MSEIVFSQFADKLVTVFNDNDYDLSLQARGHISVMLSELSEFM